MNSTTTIKIRGYHLDMYGHVNNARYLELLEEARWRHYEDLDYETFKQNGWGFVIVNININYRHPATVGDVIRIETQLKNVGSRSIVVHQEIFLGDTDTKVVDADVTFVILSLKTGKPVTIEGELREMLVGDVSG